MTEKFNAGGLPAETHIGRTALRVSDLVDTTDFYENVVGLAVLDREASRATLGVDGEPLLVLQGDPDAPARGRDETGLFHMAFRVPNRAALGDALGRIRDGWRLEGASNHGVSEALYLSDPEGNGVEIYRDFPREEWPRTADGLVHMTTQRLDIERVAEAGTGRTEAPSGTDIGHVHLEVSSLDAFRVFYVDVMGFDVEARMPDALFVGAGGYHHHIGANRWNQRSSPNRASSRGISWFELVLPNSPSLEVLAERLMDSGTTADWGKTGISVTDPDDIEIRIVTENSV